MGKVGICDINKKEGGRMSQTIDEVNSIVPVSIEWMYRHIEHAVSKWDSFCTIKEKEKEVFSWPHFETDFADPGYKRKNEVDGYDEKEYFHFIPAFQTFLNMNGLSDKNIHPIASEFFSAGCRVQDDLVQFLTSRHQSPFRLSDDIDLNCRIRKEIVFSKHLITLRFLKYLPKVHGEEISKPHVDKSGLSIALYCSHGGLQYAHLLDHSGELVEWRDVEITKESGVVFPSHQMLSFSGRKIKPLAHRVIQAKMNEPRYSVVLFIPFLSERRFPKHLRTQDMMEELGYKL